MPTLFHALVHHESTLLHPPHSTKFVNNDCHWNNDNNAYKGLPGKSPGISNLINPWGDEKLNQD